MSQTCTFTRPPAEATVSLPYSIIRAERLSRMRENAVDICAVVCATRTIRLPARDKRHGDLMTLAPCRRREARPLNAHASTAADETTRHSDIPPVAALPLCALERGRTAFHDISAGKPRPECMAGIEVVQASPKRPQRRRSRSFPLRQSHMAASDDIAVVAG